MSRSIVQTFYCESYRSARAQIDIGEEEDDEDEEQVDAMAVTSALRFRELGMHTPGGTYDTT